LQSLIHFVKRWTCTFEKSHHAYTVAVSRKKECSSCHIISLLEDETYNLVPLSIEEYKQTRAQKQEKDVQSMLVDALADEVLTKKEHHIRCDSCGLESDHTISKGLNKLPNVLLLAIKRYNAKMQKVKSRVKVNQTIRVNGSNGYEEQGIYRLKAIVMHTGNDLRGGHYTAAVETTNGQWYRTDDAKISQSEVDDILEMAAEHCYILFYDRLESEVSDNQTDGYNENTVMNRKAENKEVASIDDLRLRGRDLKTLEYPQQDFSYSVQETEQTGWINDNIVCAVMKHIERNAKSNGMLVKAMGTTFLKRLERFNDPKSDPLQRKNVIEEQKRQLKNCNVLETQMFLVPRHVGGNHWTIYIVSHCNRDFNEVTFYDPQGLESANKQVAKLLANFFAKAKSDS